MADYFSQNQRRRNSVTQDRLNAPLPPAGTPGGRPVRPTQPRESLRQPSSIRIRRLPSNTPSQQQSRPMSQASDEGAEASDFSGGRRRSMSAPQRYQQNLAPPGAELTQQRTAEAPHMGTISEGVQLPPGQVTPYYDMPQTLGQNAPSINIETPSEAPMERATTGASAMQNAGNAAQRNRGLRRLRSSTVGNRSDNRNRHDEYDSDVVDLLDLLGMCRTRRRQVTRRQG